ncbi:MAG: hypothetical protein A2440_03005 [Stygiobacter sp. RIFOXYC2_FULL_38_25]|nr:MAG: hypothetical protein A2X62_10920 [Stygiobacter sp. GWC2_38_9]OGV06961.1 MAG: hypothetical protein A2299_16500 [Stygiobacter sp. RIFOXYB2_FULL_37_11]OGV12175.1 MAG: hypothetical protein A2237_02805 [Stygiobacter sp. RIFOXYA2_FULL_38_8]OGV15918.1 MAG: hypothetical protein A2440_03005 [Stygiobacter sp. RIFOXYC2_FULL_38_25]OGV80395.1 MAG: hypothetical protein A2X65_04165 [Stygiobacter sp. GWF2_38_21]
MFKFSKTVDYQFIARAHNNDLSPEEKEFFEQWLSESEKNRETYSEIALLLDKFDLSQNPSLPDKNIQWQNIRQRVLAERNTQALLNLEREPKASSSSVFKILHPLEIQTDYWRTVYTSKMLHFALTLIVVASVGLSFLIEQHSTKKNRLVSFVEPATKYLEVKTNRGEKLSVTLPDGSKVHLNTLSKLTYPETFGERTRDVVLEGEAYFSVASNKEKPFSVKSGNVLTVVTGTEFDIKNRGERISVVVVKGSVNTFSPTKEEVFKLKKGDLLSFDNRIRMPKVQKANLRHYLAWRNDKFSFEHTRLSDVMDEIERYYNIKTSFQSDSLKNITMTGFFGSDSLNKILSVISLTLDIKLKYENRTIFINKN